MGEYGRIESDITNAVKAVAEEAVKSALNLGTRRMQDELKFAEDDAMRHIKICLKQLVEEC